MQAVLRCQHCSHQFVLGEMIDAEMGFWEVVEDPNLPSAKGEAAGETMPANSASLAEAADSDFELELEKTAEYVSPQTLLKSQEAEKKKTERSKFEPISHEQYERMRRKSKSPFWSMLSVLLGGLASIPIATLLIWHVLGKDPLQMGPAVARFAPWIVPTRFRPRVFHEEVLPPAPAAGTSGFRRFDNLSMDGAASSPSDAEVSSHAVRTTPETSNENVPSNVAATGENQEPANASSDAFSMINQVKQDFAAWNDRGDDQDLKKKIAFQTYTDLSSLALAINQMPPTSPVRRQLRTELRSVAQQVKEHVDIQELLQGGTRHWIKTQLDSSIGLSFVIKVARATEAGDVWHVAPETALGSEPIQIVVPKEILPSLSEGQTVFAIGCLTRAKSAGDTTASDQTPKPTSVLTTDFVYLIE